MQTKICDNCYSKNVIRTNIDTEAFQCWNCQAFDWLDDQYRLEHQVFYGLDYDGAERNLRSGLVESVDGEMGI